MDSVDSNSLSRSKPSIRIGLSRKRKSFISCNGIMKKNILGKCCEGEVRKEDIEIISKMKTFEVKQMCETSEESVNDTTDEKNVLKCAKVMNCKTVEIETLYSTWRNGCKNAFLYLLDLTKNIWSEGVDVEELMRELGILNVMSAHFKNDLDLPFTSLYYDKNIADVNAWLTKKMSVFKPSKENEKLLIRIPRRVAHRSEIPRRTDHQQKPIQKQEENAKRNRDEMDHYRLRAKQLRDEFNALYKDLVTLRREKSEFYENFAKQNIDALVQMIYEIHRAEDEMSSLEEEIGLTTECGRGNVQKKPQPKEVTPVKTEAVKPSTEGAVVRSPHVEAQEVLKTLKEITGKLKEQLASVHNYVSSLNQEGNGERHGDQLHNNAADVKKERMKRYDCLLKDLGIKPH